MMPGIMTGTTIQASRRGSEAPSTSAATSTDGPPPADRRRGGQAACRQGFVVALPLWKGRSWLILTLSSRERSRLAVSRTLNLTQ